MKDNLYNPADSQTVKAYNSNVTFCESAHEVTREEREQANSRVADLIEETKKQISNQD